MKNMLEELKNLNNEENYNVPDGFRDRVIEQINAEKKSNIFKYIIPACSVAVVAICIVVTTGYLKNKSSDTANEKLFASNELKEESLELDSFNDVMFATDATGNAIEESADMAKKTVMSNETLKEFEDEIINMLGINKIEAEKTENGIKAKGNKEDIEVILFYFIEQIDITQDGEYVIIKEK